MGSQASGSQQVGSDLAKQVQKGNKPFLDQCFFNVFQPCGVIRSQWILNSKIGYLFDISTLEFISKRVITKKKCKNKCDMCSSKTKPTADSKYQDLGYPTNE